MIPFPFLGWNGLWGPVGIETAGTHYSGTCLNKGGGKPTRKLNQPSGYVR